MSEFPYPGLRPFNSDETDIFFGREEQTDELLERLGKTKFLSVVGPSGCGKSSLVRTGLLAGLDMDLLAGAGTEWRVAELRPGHRPFMRLAEALADEKVLGHLAEYSNSAEAAAFLHATLTRGPLGLHEVLQDTPLPEDASLLVLVDQFEEIFRYYRQQGAADEAAAFIALLLGSVKHPAVYVVITMRSDFLGDCALFEGLAQAINQGLYLIPRLNREQLREAIETPAKVFGGSVQPALVNQLLNDAGSDPDQLPVLQHALMRMWHKTATQGGVLEMRHYQESGMLEYALSRHADEAYAELDKQQQKIAEILFRGLTELGPDNRAIRRPVKLGEAADLAGVEWPRMAAVIEVFRCPGRSFLTPPASTLESEKPSGDLTPDTVLDISHESLIRQWQRLKSWTRDEAESAELYQRLEGNARRWQQGQAPLPRSPELENMLAWRETKKPDAVWAARYARLDDDAQADTQAKENFELAMHFLDAGVTQQQTEQAQAKEAEAQKRRGLEQKRKAVWLSLFLAVSVCMSGLASWQWLQAEEQRSLAEKQSAIAEKQRTVAEISKNEAKKQSRLADAARKEAESLREQEERQKQKAQRSHVLFLTAQANQEKAGRDAEFLPS
ncbi:MAG: AAA family ATPase [Gammaproteobacteria bacterium]|nr:AAA family ATPase [Gammaproteobacteria bacterium]